MGLERLLVHLDAIAVWIGPLAQVGYGAIHLNLTGFDQLLSLPSGGNPVLGKNFLEPLCHGFRPSPEDRPDRYHRANPTIMAAIEGS
jgi:hypothetical protein